MSVNKELVSCVLCCLRLNGRRWRVRQVCALNAFLPLTSVIIETDKEMSLLPLGVSLPGFPNPFCRLTKLHNRLCNFISAEISEALNLLLISEGWLPVEVWRKEKSSPQCGVSVYLGSSLDLSYLANIGYFMISCLSVISRCLHMHECHFSATSCFYTTSQREIIPFT